MKLRSIVIVFVVSLVMLSIERAEAREIWNCALSGGPIREVINNYLQIDRSTAALGVAGGDLVDIFLIKQNNDAMLIAALDNATGHQDMTFNKRKTNIKIVWKRLSGDIAFIQTGRCVRKEE